MWSLFFVTVEALWQRSWAIVSRAAQCRWDHSRSSDLTVNGDQTTKFPKGWMMVFERNILSILSCSKIVNINYSCESSFQLHKPVSFAIRICLVLLYFGKLQFKWTGCSVFATSVQIILSSPLLMFLATLARIASLHLKSHDSRSQTQLNICWVRFNSNIRSH